MAREDWQGRITYYGEVACADCDDSETAKTYTASAVAEFKRLGWRKLKRDGKSLWVCPKCVEGKAEPVTA